MTRWRLVAELGIWLLVGAACAGDDDAATDARSETGDPGEEVREDADASIDGETPDVPDEDGGTETAPDDAGPDTVADDGGSEIPVVLQPLGVVADRQDLVADSTGRLHLIRSVRRTLYAGRIEDWAVVGEVEVPADELSGWAARPLAAVTPDGTRLHVVWVGPDFARATRLHHAERDPAGVWSQEVVLDGGSSFYAEPAIAAGGDGRVHIVAQHWADGSASEPTVYTWRDAAGSWSEPVVLSPPDGAHRDISAATGPDGSVHAAYAGLRTAYSRHAARGALLSDGPQLEVPARATGVRSYYGDLFVEPDGTVHRSLSTWDGDVATVDYTRRSAGGEWSVPVVASGGPLSTTIESRSAIGVARDGTVFVLWGESDAAGDRCRLAVGVAGGWTTSTLDEAAGIGSQEKPSVAVTDATVVAVWRHGDGELWIAGLWRRP